MSKQKKIIEALKMLHAKPHYDASSIIVGKVIKVDGINSIDVDVEGIVYYDVQLQALEDGSGTSLIVVPASGSQVLIGNIEQCTGYALIKADKADRILLKQADGMYIDIVKGVVKLNGDEKGGLVQVQDLTNKINALEQKVNDLIIACQSQVVTLAPSGAFPLVGFFTSVTPLVQTQRDELENKNVKHG